MTLTDINNPSRSRNPVILAALVGGSALFIGLKWRAVLARSEAAKIAGSKDSNYAVAPGRSGKSNRTCVYISDVYGHYANLY